MRKLLLFLLLLIGSFVLAQQEVIVVNVEVWVKVTDENEKTARGLRLEDFEVYEENQKVSPTCFEEIDTSKTSEKEMPPNSSPGLVQKFVLFLDLFNTTPEEYQSLKPYLQEFLAQIRPTRHEVMVTALRADGKLGIVAPFTKNIDAVAQLLEKAPANSRRDEALRKRAMEMRRVLLPFSDASAHEVTREQALREAFRLAKSYMTQDKQEGEFCLAALESFARHLQAREKDHINIVFVSGGMNGDPGRYYYDLLIRLAEKTGMIQESQARFELEFPESKRELTFDFQRAVQQSIGKLNRLNVTLYSINTRSTYIPGSVTIQTTRDHVTINDVGLLQDYRFSLSRIAEETGGLFFDSKKDFARGLDKILDDLSHQYLICYSPPEKMIGGQYRSIRVVVKKPGLKVRHRKGYLS